jgi:hypothetical protein
LLHGNTYPPDSSGDHDMAHASPIAFSSRRHDQ